MTTILRQRMAEDMQIRNLSPLTQSCYVQQVSMFARHFGKSPAVLGIEDIRDYQLYLTNQKKLDASSIRVAVSALRFLYRVTLKRPWDFIEAVPSPKKPQILPIVLSPEEVLHFLRYHVASATRRVFPGMLGPFTLPDVNHCRGKRGWPNRMSSEHYATNGLNWRGSASSSSNCRASRPI